MTPLHVHTRYEERVYVISGSLTVWVGPAKLIVAQASTITSLSTCPTPSRPPPRTPTPCSSALRPGSPSSSPARARPPTWQPPASEPDLELFMAVTTELGDVLLGPPGTTPADLDQDARATRGSA